MLLSNAPRIVWISFVTLFLAFSRADAGEVRFHITTPQAPPEWALLEREVLRANAAACEEFIDRYWDDRGYLLCVERWGGDDGPDDAIESLQDWPLLYALGGPETLYRRYLHAWEGHLRQYTQARTVEVPIARTGMYFKEFPVMFDWLHNGEGLCTFNLQGLCDSTDLRFQQRVRRYAGFYMNEDPGAPNYDAQHKLIRSMFNGSRGPLMRRATGLDWAGDPIDVENRFRPKHGEETYAQMLEHFKDYNDIVGDHPQNLEAAWLATNAYMLSHEEKYKTWVLEYVDAWAERMRENGGIIPTNIGLDGKIGGAAGGKWYGGVYGWGFSVRDPATGRMVHRNRHAAGFHGFMCAYLLTGDDKYLDPWRKQIELINAQAKMVDGQPHYPHMYGDQGWYDYRPDKYTDNALPLYYLSQRPGDRVRVATEPWVEYLQGLRPAYPVEALRNDLNQIRTQVAKIRADTTTPDTRLADDPMVLNPASIDALLHLMCGGLPPANTGSLLHCRLRYFDEDARRPGLPEGVAALVEKMTADETVVTLVNIDTLHARRLTVQAGAYGEHAITDVAVEGDAQSVQKGAGARFQVTLEPGCGATLRLRMQRHSLPPTLKM